MQRRTVAVALNMQHHADTQPQRPVHVGLLYPEQRNINNAHGPRRCGRVAGADVFGNREQNADQVISHQLVALQQQRHHLLGPLVDLIRVVGLDGGCAAEGVYSDGHGTRVYGRAAPPTRQLTTE